FFIYFIIFAGMAGYFVWFWPGRHPVRRVIWLVCIPALLGLGLMLARVLYLGAAPSSVLESASSVFGHRLRWAEATLWKLPEGFQFTLLGLVLIAIFTSRMIFGIASLPVTLQNAGILEESSTAWRRLQIVIFVLIGPLFLVSALLSFTFSVGTAVLSSTGHFVVDRQLWVAHGLGKIPEPEIGAYWDIPDLHFLLLFFGAFFEEIIFRGLLQKRFIQRCGMYRGIFFVGIVWAAFHFFSDFSFMRATDLMVLEHLGTRLFMCETLSFVLGWLTLRSKSVIPA